MLYEDRNVGGVSFRLRLAELWRVMVRSHKADLDVQALSPYLQRDLGVHADFVRAPRRPAR